jgi:hypothetical protein
MKKKQVIRLTESDLHNIIRESVKNILKESFDIQNNYNWELALDTINTLEMDTESLLREVAHYFNVDEFNAFIEELRVSHDLDYYENDEDEENDEEDELF